MPRMLSINSTARTPIVIAETTGDNPRSVTLNPCGSDGKPVTTGNVPSDLFYDWLAANPGHPARVHRLIDVLPLVDEPATDVGSAPSSGDKSIPVKAGKPIAAV